MPVTRVTVPKPLRGKRIGLFLIYWRYIYYFVVLFVSLSAIGYREFWKKKISFARYRARRHPDSSSNLERVKGWAFGCREESRDGWSGKGKVSSNRGRAKSR